MADDTFVLVMLVIVMLIGSYTAGSIPLIMKLSEEKLKILTVLGAGLLVGTALTVIIPEGIRSLYLYGGGSSNANADYLPSTMSLAFKNNFLVQESRHSHREHQTEPMHSNFKDHSRTIGLSLALGFTFMMIIDQLSQKRQSSAVSSTDERKITATLGLVVHAAADGIALGAAATTSHHDVEIIVFLAIMLHKAPAAFGLVSFLLHEKIDRQRIRKHLAIFSSSAPLLTLLTYFSIGQEQKKTLDSVNATAIAMLFSAGTFLYVATVHVLPELTQRGGSTHHHSPPTVTPYTYTPLQDVLATSSTTSIASTACAVDVQLPQQATGRLSNSRNAVVATKGLRYIELIFMIFGILLPLLITLGHKH